MNTLKPLLICRRPGGHWLWSLRPHQQRRRRSSASGVAAGWDATPKVQLADPATAGTSARGWLGFVGRAAVWQPARWNRGAGRAAWWRRPAVQCSAGWRTCAALCSARIAPSRPTP